MAASAKQLGEIEGRLTRLQQELSDREQQRDALYQELERNERDIAALARAGRQLTEMVDEQQRNLTELEARLVKTGDDLAVARKDLAELLRSAYAMGRGDRLRMLLNREDLTRNERVFGYYRCIGRVRAARLDAVEQLAAELVRLGTESRDEAQRLQRLAERQAETRLRLEAVQVERNAIVADLDANIAAGRGELVTLNANAQALRTLIERLRRQVQIAAEIEINQEAIVARKGRLAWPISEGRLASRFRGGAGDQDLHADGVLIETDEGSEVRAVHHGRVVYADWLRGFGLLLVIDHGDGYMTLYGHNQALLKEVGEWIATGEVIALTGASGGSGNSGLYFALRYQGKPLDPELWCRGRG
jgi:septal ring factor EnvC (AmiA/AmiB activator)